jgi:hypothetical protein
MLTANSGVSRSVFTKRNPWSSRVIYFHARRGFARWREQYIPVRVRLAQKPNAAMASAAARIVDSTLTSRAAGFLLAERRERRKSKAGFCAMARAVHTGTRASRAKAQRGYGKRSSSAGKKKGRLFSRPKS